ncbi:unnamed protein product [Phytophthora lilii]|uniref:Unnamed protein product n=1 Tax=Phytophthora lilii TaxID=2077276 RepID=A0A9W6TWJ2_9STRA|nr:unnamed protein product [Phytophthora lilii]
MARRAAAAPLGWRRRVTLLTSNKEISYCFIVQLASFSMSQISMDVDSDSDSYFQETKIDEFQLAANKQEAKVNKLGRRGWMKDSGEIGDSSIVQEVEDR